MLEGWNVKKNLEEINKAIEGAEHTPAGPMDESAAHNEANMLRAGLGVSPETGGIPRDGEQTEQREPKAEDYDKALKNLQRLKEIALTDAEAITVIDQIITLPYLGVSFLARLTKALAGRPGETGKRWQEGEAYTDGALDLLFGEAFNNIRKLQDSGNKFGKEEGKINNPQSNLSDADKDFLRDLKINPD